ncbi:unnamed protein product [Soboliphyme baturini]|uniref:PH_15 domain-containing protein n=1 Tax=Soboliphyme baturini TaxID=241478 RepID=A0A183IT03_9BILA|nr:unnamed protein product [Soboliphyme baturini]
MKGGHQGYLIVEADGTQIYMTSTSSPDGECCIWYRAPDDVLETMKDDDNNNESRQWATKEPQADARPTLVNACS